MSVVDKAECLWTLCTFAHLAENNVQPIPLMIKDEYGGYTARKIFFWRNELMFLGLLDDEYAPTYLGEVLVAQWKSLWNNIVSDVNDDTPGLNIQKFSDRFVKLTYDNELRR